METWAIDLLMERNDLHLDPVFLGVNQMMGTLDLDLG